MTTATSTNMTPPALTGWTMTTTTYPKMLQDFKNGRIPTGAILESPAVDELPNRWHHQNWHLLMGTIISELGKQLSTYICDPNQGALLRNKPENWNRSVADDPALAGFGYNTGKPYNDSDLASFPDHAVRVWTPSSNTPNVLAKGWECFQKLPFYTTDDINSLQNGAVSKGDKKERKGPE